MFQSLEVEIWVEICRDHPSDAATPRQDLFHVYQGSTNCCACGHRLTNGLSIPCDKDRVATTLVGLYGTMLVQAMRLRESRLKSADQINFLETRLVKSE